MTEFTFEELRPSEGDRHAVGDGTTVGREGCDVILADLEVSRRHAAFRVTGTEIAIEDLGSSNGTFVNERQVGAPTPLAPGDEVRMGDTVWRLAGTPAAETIIRGRAPEPPAREAEPAPVAEPEAPPPPTPPAAEPEAPADGSRGDVPVPPDPSASVVRPAPAVDPGAPPAFEAAGPAARRASAARSEVATRVSFAVILATAVALVIYFGARDEPADDGGAERGQPRGAETRGGE